MMDINIGDIVEVIPQDDKPWTLDWREQFVVVGINAKRMLQYDISTLDYTIVPVGHPEDGGTDGFSAEDLRVVTAAPQPPAHAVAVRVKPLIFPAPYSGIPCQQETPWGTYVISGHSREYCWDLRYTPEPVHGHPTAIAAMQAANAHWEGAILSAIDARPEVAVKAEEREAIAREAERYAGHYQPGSDGRNTFTIFAEAIRNGTATRNGRSEADRLEKEGAS